MHFLILQLSTHSIHSRVCGASSCYIVELKLQQPLLLLLSRPRSALSPPLSLINGRKTHTLPACHCHLSLKISMADGGSGTTRCRRPANAQCHDERKQQNITGQSLNWPGQKRSPHLRHGAHTDLPRQGNSMADPFPRTFSGITKQTQIVANLTVLYGLEMFLYLSFTHEIYDTLV